MQDSTFRLTLKSQLILALVTVTVLAVSIVAIIAVRNGRAIIVADVSQQLVSVRASKANQIEAYFADLRDHVITLAETRAVVGAARTFSEAVAAVDIAAVPDGVRAAVDAWYRAELMPRLAENVSGRPLAAQYVPTDAASLRLQHDWIVANPNPLGAKKALDDTSDGSPYAVAHALHHGLFRDYIERYGYYDLFLVDPRSRVVVYSVSKETDFAMPVDRGPYAAGGLDRVVASVLASPDPRAVAVADFAPYRPSLAAPAAFIAAPVFDGADLVGIVALQLSIDHIDAVMTGDQDWAADGLGQTGETYLVGRDRLMRSDSRFLLEEPEAYFERIAEAGIDRAQIENMRRFGTTILHQEVRTPSVDAALANRSGTGIIEDYRGERVLSAYAPLEIEGLDWVIVAEKDVDEAYAPMRRFARHTLISIAVAIFAATLAAMTLAEAFAAPIRRLIDDVVAIGTGKRQAVSGPYRNEFARLAEAIDATSAALHGRAEGAHGERQRTDALLQRLLPRSVIGGLLERGDSAAERHPSVSVLFANVIGMSALTDALPAERYIEMLNGLVGAFDDACRQHGVERIATHGADYMAASGVSVMRPDHVRCVTDLAVAMMAVVRRFNRDRDTRIDLAVGISEGSVVSGVVGRDRIAWDLSGPAARIAHLLKQHAPAGSILVTDEIRTSVGSAYDFDDAGIVETSDGTEVHMWSLRWRGDTPAEQEPSP